MVKNTTGGTGTKSLARKHQVRGDGGRLRLPTCELEQIAIVTKMLGNGMCEIHTNDNVRLMGHIRSSFRGKQKRHNLVAISTIVLVGMREWENPYKNCDILTIYDSLQVEQMRNMPSINIKKLLELQLGNAFSVSSRIENEIIFSKDDDDEEDATEISKQPKLKHSEAFLIESSEKIDFDDI